MMSTVYFICLLISVFTFIYFVSQYYKNIDIYVCSTSILVMVVELGYWLKTQIATPEGARICMAVIYFESTILVTLIIFAIFRAINVVIRPWIKALAYTFSFGELLLVWLSVFNNNYYTSIELIDTGYGISTKMHSGPLKPLHYIFLAIIFIVLIGALVYGHMNKKMFSRKNLMLYTIAVFACITIYAVELLTDAKFSVLPIFYTVVILLVAKNYNYFQSHDISGVVSLFQQGHSQRGYIIFDFNGHLLNSNTRMKELFPELLECRIDEKLKEGTRPYEIFSTLIKEYEENEITNKEFKSGELIFSCDLSLFSLSRSGKPMGYLMDVKDITEEKRAMEIMTSYNEILNAEVASKIDNIKRIQEKVVLGLANMVENRDNNTGGHVKRTRDITKILVHEIQKQKIFDISDEFAEGVVRAASMHDLGKISIDSAILCKPGKLTAEEYDIMKTHSTKSGEMVKILIDGVEEDWFVDVAYNVARYHHERWDGKGYPEGLVGNMIPLEARIMAVADVYDALVSERCYKKAMSFEEAQVIMRESMGTQFDPRFKSAFDGCRLLLEEYYRKHNEKTLQ